MKNQIIIWTNFTLDIGGIETFIYNFCKQMKTEYNILVLYDEMDDKQIDRLREHVRVLKINKSEKYNCDTILVNRISDSVPSNVSYKQKIQMVHGCKIYNNFKIPTANIIIPVSNVVKESFKEDLKSKENVSVINNLTYFEKPNRVLRLISATRLTSEKGESRMITLAKEMNKQNIPFIWTVFSNKKLSENIDNMVYMKPTLNIRDYIAASDYLVQLSDSEAFCYSIVEALELGVPVITTDLPVLPEIGVKDKVNGIIFPFDMKDISSKVSYLYNNVLTFDYKYDNEKIKKQWKNIIGKKTQEIDYKPNNKINIEILDKYFDLKLNRMVNKGEIICTKQMRADKIINAGLGKEVKV